jgi:putative aminopeptidase FrvX
MNDIATLLQMFSDTHGMSGYEDDVAALLRKELEPLVDEVRVDTMGNVIGTRSGEGPTVMVAAHIDEIGLAVSHIDDDGFLRVVSVGGFSDQVILGQRMLVHGYAGKTLIGVVGARPPHLMDAEERKKLIKLKEMFIDIGASSAANAAELGVEIGSPVTLDRQFARLGNDFVTGKALDNRAGVAMMVSALQRLKGRPVKATIHAVGTVQEEVGLKGARTSAFGLTPDVAIATDVTIPGDNPGVSKNECHVCSSKGPSITILDAGGRGIIAPRPVVRWLRETAERESIPYQLSVGDGGNTDATAISITKAGIPCSVIACPTRYIHSPVEVLSISDLDNGAALIAAAIETAHHYFPAST